MGGPIFFLAYLSILLSPAILFAAMSWYILRRCDIPPI